MEECLVIGGSWGGKGVNKLLAFLAQGIIEE